MNDKNKNLTSNKNFGLFFSLVFGFLSIKYYPDSLYINFIWLSLMLFLVSIFYARCLSPLNFAWFKLGLFLSKLTNPFVMSVLFFFILAPLSLIMRSFGYDPLKINKVKTKTYWVDRNKKNNNMTDFYNQF